MHNVTHAQKRNPWENHDELLTGVGIHDVITSASFYDYRLRRLGVARGQILGRTDRGTARRTDLLYQYLASMCWRAIKIVQYLWNLVHYIRYWTRLQLRDQKFFKFKMAAAAIFRRHLENRFLATTHRSIVQFQRNFVWGSRTACRQGLNDKICKFLKSKMAFGRHFENR